MTLQECITRLEALAPLSLAESWDNVGLLLGDRSQPVGRIMTCLTLTPDVAREAIHSQADLVITHHPILFRAVQRLTDDTIEGGMIMELVRAHISVYSPHTAYDSATAGSNQQIAEGLELQGIQPLRPVLPPVQSTRPAVTATSIGAGRHGRLKTAQPLCELVHTVAQLLKAPGVQYVGDGDRAVSHIAIACGAAAEFLTDAVELGCDALLTGEARFHSALEARHAEVALILPGHYATERPAVETLADRLRREWSGTEVWASRDERDPLTWTLL
ncbi:MAG: Nif3-like dinuclear metal center hexameric protein [Planctomycetaceae bacterium]